MDRIIDLRSDTVTRPDAAMIRAMGSAPLGDDVFGDDPTVQAFEAKAAEVTGKEAALFVPSGTMANSIAIAVSTRPGDEMILEAQCHSFNFECAGASRLWGVQPRVLSGERGRIPIAAIEAAIRPQDIHMPRTRLVILEQTSNIAGGCILPLDYLKSVSELSRRLGLAFHLDGARIFNAAVATGTSVREYASTADTVMFCISKGLGAPAGSVLAGPRALISEGRRVRKLLGGGMRQAGVLAACGLHALEANVERLSEDHRRAREIAEALYDLAPRGLVVTPPETNMVYLSWPGDDAERYGAFTTRLEDEGVLAVALGERGVRLVLHKDVDGGSVDRVREALRRLLDRVLP